MKTSHQLKEDQAKRPNVYASIIHLKESFRSHVHCRAASTESRLIFILLPCESKVRYFNLHYLFVDVLTNT